MSLFKKEMRDEEYFYNMISELTPLELMALTRAFVKFMGEFKNISADLSQYNKVETDDGKPRKEIS